VQEIKKDALFVIDGSYLLYRSFYAIRTLYTSSGVPTQATYGFCRAIKKLIDDFNPHYLVVAWDSPGKSFRNHMYAEYKATRQKAPNELAIQKEYIIKFLDAITLAQVAESGYEADDIIAGFAKQHNDRQVVLVCPDKDMYQLLSDNLVIFDPFKNRIIDQETYKTEQGFGPEKISFYYALLGDASDNIPGVSGIGKKTAQDLVMQFDNLDDLYQNIANVSKERTRTLLSEQKEQAYLSLQLFTLKPPPLHIKIEQLTLNKNNWYRAAPLFKELEFESLLKDIEKRFPDAYRQALMPKGKEVNASIFDQPTEQEWNLVIVQDEQTLQDLVKLLERKKTFALDTETTGCIPLQDEMVGISFAADTTTAFYIPLAHNDCTQIPKARVLELLRPVLESDNSTIIMHHAKFDQLVLYNSGIAISPIAFDTLLAANLVRREWQKINLKELSLRLLNEPMIKFKDILGKLKTFAEVPIQQAARYGAHDSLQTLKIKPILEAELDKEPTLKKLFNTIEMPLYWVLLRMECMGIILDPERLQEIGLGVNKEIALIENKIFGAIDGKKTVENFNLNSPKQIEWLLFEELKLPPSKKSAKGQRSTDQEVLKELSNIHPIPGLILQHRELSKLKNTYIDPLPTFINPKTGRIHTTFRQEQVATGRLSSSDPNMQNIPVAEGFGAQIREAFRAPQGKIFMSADYSQIELRVLAHMTKDPTLIDVFTNDRDIHTQTAAQLFDIKQEDVTSQQRQLGKRINFSIMYGMSPFGLAKDLNIKQSDAKAYIEKYFAQYPNVAAWMEKTVQQAIIDGYVETLFGRRRYIPELREKNRTIFENGRRMAINTPIQGTQAEIMKMAMINIDHQFIDKKLEARMILQIHDEIIIELPNEEENIVEKIVRKDMETVVAWNIPLKVTIRTGKNWAEVTK